MLRLVPMTKPMSATLATLEGPLLLLFKSLRASLLACGEDTSHEVLNKYVGFKRRRNNFARVKVRPSAHKVLLLLPDAVKIQTGVSLDIRHEPHYGGEWEVTIRSQEELERTRPLLRASYDVS